MIGLNGWKKVEDGGWLPGEPAYESPDGKLLVARDWDDEDSDSKKTVWFLHDDTGFVAAYETLKEAINGR